ncbi:hypothetical protein [Halorussus ruber]|uniref:hypothetical protein n=1 Tax=Halorussus ruber TaxID=1126238 RepID=UPI001091A7BE|nr:hypothetical protein [Halorussus ruber]
MPSDETGLDIIDPVETRHFSLRTDEPADPTPSDTEPFAFPVETACRISVGEIRLPYLLPVDVRTPDGDPLRSVDSPSTHELADDDYLLELHSPIKVYLRVSGRVRIEATTEEVVFEFSDDAAIEIGARSYHSAPGETITVPDDPEAMMKAVSMFPSALKTLSPERAWPTLRGHPPRIERGDELDVPSDIDVPETGIRITVPSEYWAVYTVAPLAYYLGAEVVPGDGAHVTADSGAAHYLGDEPAEIADATETLLKRVFFLDCVVRTEGLYPDELHERNVLESRADVDLDFAGLYEASPAERLATYLSVPDEAIEAISSPWHRVTHTERNPGPEVGELLPYLVNDLSLVRPKVERDESAEQSEINEELDDALGSFLRRPSASEQVAAGEDFVRSVDAPNLRRDGESGGSASGVPDLDEYVTLPEVDALEQAWVGEGTPTRGTKLIEAAFTNETPEPSDGTIDIAVVCNDDRMREEWESVGEIYGSRDDVPASVTSKVGVSTGELRELFAEDHDVFHFIGHIDGQGFECPDGVLDAGTVEEVNATTVLLNGCRSHHQGIELVKAGASAAIVSLADLFNSGAVEVGETLARLLHYGFGIGAAMKIIREYTSIGDRYVVVGNPSVVVAQCESGMPTLCHVKSIDRDAQKISVIPYAYPAQGYGLGTNFKPAFLNDEKYYVAVGKYTSVVTTFSNLNEQISSYQYPLISHQALVWSGGYLE